jgi:hypothetical protein
MGPKQRIEGRMLDCHTPDWEPLLEQARILVGDFMWMFSVELEDGRRLQAYKHIWTRRYLHLDGDGGAYVYTDDDRYQQVDPSWLLHLALDARDIPRDP